MIFDTTMDLSDDRKDLIMAVPTKSADDDASSGHRKPKKLAAAAEDGSSIEVAKRPRGRPPGSKNKPKPPVVITREADPATAMRPHVLEIPAGHDVAACLAAFACRRNLGVCALAGSGPVANVTLRGSGSAGPAVRFGGRFEILSLSATFFPPAMAALSPPAAAAGMSVSLAGPQGQVIGGLVAGALVAVGTVVVVAAGFASPTFHRLPPAEDDAAVSVSVSGGGEPDAGGEQQREEEYGHHHQHGRYQQHGHRHLSPAAVEPLSMYSSHFPADVVWAPTARPPHPPPY